MKLSEYQNDYYTFTGKLSDIARQLNFAGIAIIWIFKTNFKEKILFDQSLLISAILIICSLSADLLQYSYQSTTWSIFYHVKKKQGKNDDDIIPTPEYLNYLSWILFVLKIILLVISYIMILVFLSEKISIK